MLSMVELGRVIFFVPAYYASIHARKRIAFVPVSDVSPSRVVIAWPEKARSVTLARFVRAAVDAFAPEEVAASLRVGGAS